MLGLKNMAIYFKKRSIHRKNIMGILCGLLPLICAPTPHVKMCVIMSLSVDHVTLRAGCTLNVKDFKASWRSGVVFLAILCALRPDVVSLSKARTRSNRQNLEEAFHVAERALRIPRLLDPAGVCYRTFPFSLYIGI